MTEEYELATFDRHNLNYDNVALGRLPTNVTSDPTVKSLKELTYLPQGVMDPHEVSATDSRVGKLPEEVLDWMVSSNSKETMSVGNSNK
tara:strand:+ start:61 stop:327 length:267 start_codon:yes stop_codon:yes gene_type:complete